MDSAGVWSLAGFINVGTALEESPILLMLSLGWMQDTIKDTTVYTFLAFTVRPNKHKGLFPKIGMMGRLKSHWLCSNESSKSYNFCRFCRSVLSFQTRTMRREKINLVAELGYCLKTEVFLCCQITDILSENKNKTQCIALPEPSKRPSAKTSNQQELDQPKHILTWKNM